MTIDFSGTITKASNALSRLYDKLSSGTRLIDAREDPAALSVHANNQAAITQFSAANRGLTDNLSRLSVTDGALAVAGDNLQRKGELANQSANGVFTAPQREALDGEFQSGTQSNQQIAAGTKFNGQQVLDGNSVTTSGGITIPGVTLTDSGGSIGDADSARAALTTNQQDLDANTTARGNIGASEAVIEAQINVNNAISGALAEADARTAGLDFADATGQVASAQTTLQAATSVQSAAVQGAAKTTLTLIQGAVSGLNRTA